MEGPAVLADPGAEGPGAADHASGDPVLEDLVEVGPDAVGLVLEDPALEDLAEAGLLVSVGRAALRRLHLRKNHLRRLFLASVGHRRQEQWRAIAQSMQRGPPAETACVGAS